MQKFLLKNIKNKMKKISSLQRCFLASISILLCNYCVQAQNIFPATGSAGIGTTTPDAFSVLDMVSTSKGILVPRMTKTQRDNIAIIPPTGLLIYQTNNTPGFYYYDGSAWTAVTPKPKGWLLTGNNGTNPATNFIGTQDAVDFVVRTNNVERIRITSAGNLGIGTLIPSLAKLQVQGAIGNTVGIFSSNANSQGISLVSDWPGIYFNSYYNGGVKSMAATGYASNISTDQTNGGITFGTSSAANTAAGGSVTINEKMRISKNGSVGIGTASPNSKLDVAGDIRLNDNKIYLRPGTDAFHSLGFDATLNGPLLSGYGGGGLGGTANTNTTVLRWTWDGTNGNVGIGTNSPSYKLDVCGTIRAKEGKLHNSKQTLTRCNRRFSD